MVYKQKFVAVVKCNGKVLRERDDVISLPFGSEYSLLFKNLDSRRVNVDASIDGRNVFYGHSLIIDPNEEVEIKGFLTGSTVRNRFKFIQKTKKIQEYRGDKIDDGIIRIEFAYEKAATKKKTIIHENHHHHHHHSSDYFYHYYPPVMGKDGLVDHWKSNDGTSSSPNVTFTTYNSSSDEPRATSNVTMDSLGDMGHQVKSAIRGVADNVAMFSSVPAQEEGITVEGSRVRQNFSYGQIGELEASEVIVLRIVGVASNGETITAPLTTKKKLICKTCGTSSRSNSKFCSECGTSLDI